MISNLAARILIHRIEEIFRSTKQTDDWSARAQGLQILWQKLLPQFFAKPEQEHGRRGDGDVPFQAEIVHYFLWPSGRLIFHPCLLPQVSTRKRARANTQYPLPSLQEPRKRRPP